MFLNSPIEKYRLKAWFVYRYFCQNGSSLKNRRYYDFFIKLDDFFLNKYKRETESETRLVIKQLFRYESEEGFTIDNEVIDALIDEYELNPFLLLC